jgi:YihY family inner membrane protein
VADQTTASHVPEISSPDAEDLRDALHQSSIGELMQDSFVRFRYADGFSFARSMAFQVVLAIIPGLIFVVALATRIGDARMQEMLRETITTAAPGPASQMLLQAFDQGSEAAGTGNLVAIVVGGLVAFVSGVAAMAQLQRGASRIYGVLGDRPTLQRYRVATALTLTVGIGLALGFLAIVFGSTAGGAFRDEIAEIVSWARWPMGILLATVSLAAVFKVAPNRRQPAFSWLALGGVVAVAGWLMVSVALALYLNASSTFGETYGPLAGFIGTMLWAQLSGIAIFYGLAICAQLEGRHEGVEEPVVQATADHGR